MDPWNDERRAALLLHLTAGIGPRMQQTLLGHFGSAATVLKTPYETLLQVDGIGPKLAARIATAETATIERELEVCAREGVGILLRDETGYPESLGHIADPPGALFTRGTLAAADSLSVGIVGSRHATPYGLQQAERLARGLALAGLTIVSGLARGVDAAAHRGALSADGRTIAVLASGVLRIYPPEHASLASDVARQGVVLSEAPPLRKPISGAFPQRNRLISGLTLGTLVIEAAERSGALITARHAMEQGREVFALPGRVDNRMSRGCHQLLKDGAKLVEHIDDVLEELCPLASPVPHPEGGGEVRHARELQLDPRERTVLDAIGSDPTHLDNVACTCGLPMSQVLATVSVLETRRLVQRISGGTFARL